MQVLDHGLVELLDVMGDDTSPARAARISYGRHDDREWELDAKLIKFLKDNRHDSPFEMIELLWRVRLPIFVARQWIRHRTFSYNEFSMRYADPTTLGASEEILYYVPDTYRAQSQSNKQSSTGEVDMPLVARHSYIRSHEQAIKTYRELLDWGVARELARCVLPVSVYTEWICKGNLRNWLHFFELRADPHAQWEMQQYAIVMIDLLRERLPQLMAIVRPESEAE